MTTTTFDTLGYFEKLKATGIPENQAKAQVEVLREVVEDKLATKSDLHLLEMRLHQQMRELEYKLTVRLGSMMAAAIAVVAVLVKLL